MKIPCESEDCKIMKFQEVIFGKWKLSILWYIHNENITGFNALQRALKNISHKVLADSLNELVDAGILSRKEYGTKEPKSEYALTDKGKSFIPIMEQIEEWVELNYY